MDIRLGGGTYRNYDFRDCIGEDFAKLGRSCWYGVFAGIWGIHTIGARRVPHRACFLNAASPGLRILRE